MGVQVEFCIDCGFWFFVTHSFFLALPPSINLFLLPLSQIEHLYSLTVFENYLYATNSDNANMQPKTSVIRVNRFNSSDYQVVTRVDKGGALHVYHQRRQPPGNCYRALYFMLGILSNQFYIEPTDSGIV
jgi:hypothetical protein